MKKNMLISFMSFLLLNFSCLGFTQTQNSSYTVYSYFYGKSKYNFQKRMEEPIIDKSRYVNWTNLAFYSQISKSINILGDDNFIAKPFKEGFGMQDEFIQKIYADVLKIRVNADLTISRLIFLNNDLRKFLLTRLYDPNLIFISHKQLTGVTLKCFLPFIGSGELIDLILKSHYFINREELKTVKTDFSPNHYDKLIIEAREVGFIPSLFPRIYSYDAKGEKILIYGLRHSDWDAVVKNGFVSYYNSEESVVNNPKNDYISALSTENNGYDLLISRDDYLKLFASKTSLHNLAQGNFIIITKNIPY